MLLFFGVFLCGGVAGHRFRDMASGVSETKGAGLSPGHCHVEKTGITRCREFRVSLSLSLTFWRRLRLAPQPGLKGPFTLSDCSFFDTSPFRPCLFYVPSELAFLVPPLQPLHWIPSFRTKRENHVPSPKKPPPPPILPAPRVHVSCTEMEQDYLLCFYTVLCISLKLVVSNAVSAVPEDEPRKWVSNDERNCVERVVYICFFEGSWPYWLVEWVVCVSTSPSVPEHR